jgi:hypothetical protein
MVLQIMEVHKRALKWGEGKVLTQLGHDCLRTNGDQEDK